VCGKTRAGRGSLLISGGGRLASTLPRANGRRGEEEKAPLICTLGLLFGAARQGESRRCRCDSSFRRQRPPFRPFPTSFFSACRGVASSARPRSTASVAAKAFAASPESRESRLRAVSSFVSLRRWWRVTAAGAWVSVRGSHAWLLWSWSSPPIRVVSYHVQIRRPPLVVLYYLLVHESRHVRAHRSSSMFFTATSRFYRPVKNLR
jgi:hypothetical protein